MPSEGEGAAVAGIVKVPPPLSAGAGAVVKDAGGEPRTDKPPKCDCVGVTIAVDDALARRVGAAVELASTPLPLSMR